MDLYVHIKVTLAGTSGLIEEISQLEGFIRSYVKLKLGFLSNLSVIGVSNPSFALFR